MSEAKDSAAGAADEAEPVQPVPKLGRRERNKREKRERILNAARTLFRTKGFSATTAQEIADLADVGFGTLYLYMESKEDLLIQVFEDEIDQVVEESFAAVAKDAPLPAQLESFFSGLIGYHKQDLPLARALIRELACVSSARRRRDVDALVRNIHGKVGELVRRARERGEVGSHVAPEQAARVAFAIYDNLLQAFLGEYTSEERLREQLRASFELLRAGLAPCFPRPEAGGGPQPEPDVSLVGRIRA